VEVEDEDVGIVGEGVHEGFEEEGGGDCDSLAGQHEAQSDHDSLSHGEGVLRFRFVSLHGIFVITVDGWGQRGKGRPDVSRQFFGDSPISRGGIVVTDAASAAVAAARRGRGSTHCFGSGRFRRITPP